MKDSERRDLLEFLEDRYDRSSTTITSQLPTKTWHEALGDPTIADAISDRLVHNAHVIALRGHSMRRRKAENPQAKEASDQTPEPNPSLRSEPARVRRNRRSGPAGTTARVRRKTHCS